MRHNGEVYIRKGLWTVKEFYDVVKKLPANAEIALHFRFTSSGKTLKTMCHPFSLEKNDVKRMRGKVRASMMHNGTIKNLCFRGESSDTYYLADMLSKYHPSEIEQDRFIDMVDTIVSGSRVLIFTGKTTFMFGDWKEANGCHYSNDGYKKEYTSGFNSHSSRKQDSYGNYYLEFDRGSGSYVRKDSLFD